VNVYDAGSYKIAADNIGGRAESACVVYINKAPVIDVGPESRLHSAPRTPSSSGAPKMEESQKIIPPRIIRHFQPEQLFNEGQTIILSCMVEGLPIPQVNQMNQMNTILEFLGLIGFFFIIFLYFTRR
jgi:hypothetical protein